MTDQAYSATWGDYDGDGRPDLFLATLFNTPAALFRNTASGFVRITQETSLNTPGSRAGAVWFDANNDGRQDLFVSTTVAQDDLLYLGRPSGGLDRVPGVPFNGSAGYGQSAMTFDFDRDGLADLFVPNGGGWQAEANLLLRNTGNGSFQRLTTGPVAEEVLYSVGSAAGDYDGDGWPDLFVANIYGPSSLFRNRGDGSFERLEDSAVARETESTGASSGVWADYDNDGDLDLFTTNGGPGNPLYRNDNGVLTRAEAPPLTSTGGFCIGIVLADFDNDGWLDALIARRQAGQLLFRGLGDGRFETIPDGPIPNRGTGANGLAVADYDRDGDLDVLLTNWDGVGSPSLYRNESSSNAWLQVKLVGHPSSRDGIGARVRVKATVNGRTFWQLRQIGGEDAQGSQELIAHFGLADAAAAQSLRVEWPSGLVQEFENIPARQRLTVIESTLTLVSEPTLDRQTGLYEQRAIVHATPPGSGRAVRLYALALPSGTSLANQSGTDALGPFAEIDTASRPEARSFPLTLKYHHPRRGKFPTPQLEVRVVDSVPRDIPEGDRFTITRAVPLAEGAVLVEFAAQPGARYRIEYSPDMSAWTPVPSQVTAGGTKVQWIDRGPPETGTPPSTARERFYRVVRTSPPSQP
jgi:hypothetical protein